VKFAAGPDSHMDHFAGDWDCSGRVGPFEGQVEAFTQRLEKGCLAGVLAVDEVALAGEAEHGNQARVDGGRPRDPMVVGTGEPRR
jgi:hypothetical protein